MNTVDGDDDALDEILTEVNPVAPPEEVVNDIAMIAEKHGVEHRTPELVDEFIQEHNIDPAHPPIVILRSGYQITYEPPVEDILDHLIKAILGESIVAAKEKELDDADDPTEYLAMEINDEIEHVLETTHEPTLKALFGIYLYEEIRDRFDTYAQEMTSEVAEDEPDRETFQKRLTIGLERGLPTILYHRSYTDHVDTQ